MKKVYMLTQDNCPKCFSLKSYLELGLRNKYADQIEVVKREDNQQLFYELVQKHDVMATPVLISDTTVLSDTSPSKVNDFFQKIQ